MSRSEDRVGGDGSSDIAGDARVGGKGLFADLLDDAISGHRRDMFHVEHGVSGERTGYPTTDDRIGAEDIYSLATDYRIGYKRSDLWSLYCSVRREIERLALPGNGIR